MCVLVFELKMYRRVAVINSDTDQVSLNTKINSDTYTAVHDWFPLSCGVVKRMIKVRGQEASVTVSQPHLRSWNWRLLLVSGRGSATNHTSVCEYVDIHANEDQLTGSATWLSSSLQNENSKLKVVGARTTLLGICQILLWARASQLDVWSHFVSRERKGSWRKKECHDGQNVFYFDPETGSLKCTWCWHRQKGR